MTKTRTVRLDDGRIIAYAEWGCPDAFPVFGFHGTPNSRLVHLGADAPLSAGVRLILPDRPGLGRSNFQSGRTLLDWPHDVAQLAEALGIERFAVFGVSGGGPHAAACGYALSDIVSAVGLVSAAGPAYDVPEVSSAMPPAWRALTELARFDSLAAVECVRRACGDDLARLAADANGWLGDWERTAPAGDRVILEDPAIRTMYIESCREATDDGYVCDLLILLALPWGFALEDLRVPTFVWHGEDDAVVPVDVARLAVRRLPRCTPYVLAGEGHLLVHSRAVEILAALAGSA